MTVNFENGVQKKTNKTLNTYTWREGATLDKTEYWNDWVGAPTVKNTSSYFYDIIGGKAQLKWVTIQDGRPRSVVFMYDQLGQIIKRDETDNITGAGDPHEVWYRFSGRQIGYVGNNGTLDTTYAQSIANRTAAQGNGAFFNGASGSTSAADFDLASDSLNSYAQGSNAGMYVVQSGDTLSSIAANLWGDSSLWYKLAEINGLTAETELPEGLPLIIPTGIIRDTNNASTFKPYDPNELMGNLSPTSVAPPKKGNKCGVIGQILMVVIAVVVIALTRVPVGNFFSGLFGVAEGATSGTAFTASAIATGATTAAAGSIASQAFGVATGIQEKFSWNAVALAAIGGGVGGGMGAKFPNMGDVPRAVVSNVITQGIGVATGLQKEFSWAGVATAALMPSVRRAVGAMLPATVSDFAYTVAQSSAALIVNAATRSLIEGSDFGDNIIAALPDVAGQMIGDAIAAQLLGSGRDAEDLAYDRQMRRLRANPVYAQNQYAASVVDGAGGGTRRGFWGSLAHYVGTALSLGADFLGLTDGRFGVSADRVAAARADSAEDIEVMGRPWREFSSAWAVRPQQTGSTAASATVSGPAPPWMTAQGAYADAYRDRMFRAQRELAFGQALWDQSNSVFSSPMEALGLRTRAIFSRVDGAMVRVGAPALAAPSALFHDGLQEVTGGRTTGTEFVDGTLAVGAMLATPEMFVGRGALVSGPSEAMIAGRLAEPSILRALGSNGKVSFQPTPAQANSAAFRVIVGEPEYTAGGQLVGAIYDGSIGNGALAEIKTGESVLSSSYQLRLQTYGALVNDTPFTIYTSRPLNNTFNGWLVRWGVDVKPLPPG